MCSCASACLWRSEDNLGCPPSWSVLFEMDFLVCCLIGHIPWTTRFWGILFSFLPILSEERQDHKGLLSAFTLTCWCVQLLFDCVRPIDKVNYFLFAGGSTQTSGMIMCGSLSSMTHTSRNTNLEGASKFKGMMLINYLELHCTNCPKVTCLCLCHYRAM